MIALKQIKRRCNFISLNTLSNLFLTALFAASIVSVAVIPFVAEANNITALGSISVCKIILEEGGDITDGSDIDDPTFEIAWLNPAIHGDTPPAIDVLSTARFTTPITLNADILYDDAENDAMCIVYEDIELGSYFYGEEIISGTGHSSWKPSLYNDQYLVAVEDIDDFFEYSGELFTESEDDDDSRNKNSDGHIVLNKERPDRTLIVLNQIEAEEEPEPLTIMATKIVCQNEEDLPNWGVGGHDIVPNTAEEYVSGHSNCRLESGWKFQWGNQDVSNPGDDFYGEAGSGWTTFGPTDGNGVVETTISNIDGISRIWVREVLKDGYIPFGHQAQSDYSAEMYCYKDVLNFDNYDYIQGPEYGRTYYCVAFNVETVETNSPPVITLLGDNPINLTVGDTFTDPGATASDPEDGDITDDIDVGGDTVDTSTVGTYVITYGVVDSEGLAANQVTRTVEVNSSLSPPPPSGCTSNCGGGGGGGTPIHLEVSNEKIEYVATSTVLVTWDSNMQATSSVLYSLNSYATSTMPFTEYEFGTEQTPNYVISHSMTITGLSHGIPYYFRPLAGRSNEEANGIELSITLPEIPGDPIIPVSCEYLLEYIKFGEDNNPVEVRKLQVFLRDFEEFSELSITEVYDQETYEAVRKFQEKYRSDILDPWALEDPTGYVYITTKKKINEIYCQKSFPLTVGQQIEIEEYKALVERLEAAQKAGDESAGQELEEIREEVGQAISTSTIAAGIELPDFAALPESKRLGGEFLSAAISFVANNKTLTPFSMALMLLLAVSWIIQIVLWQRYRKKKSITRNPVLTLIDRLKSIKLGRGA